MEVIKIPVGLMSVNTYLYYDPVTLQGIVIDPGFEAEKIWAVIQKASLRITGTILTHGHYDHMGEVRNLFQHTASMLYAGRAEAMVLRNASINASRTHLAVPIEITEYAPLDEGTMIQVGQNQLRTILTPGHTVGSICLYDEAEGVLFAGDTLFQRSVGRTDFPTGDQAALVDSIQSRLFTLPDDVVVYPGHGASTTIGYEKKNNPYVRPAQ